MASPMPKAAPQALERTAAASCKPGTTTTAAISQGAARTRVWQTHDAVNGRLRFGRLSALLEGEEHPNGEPGQALPRTGGGRRPPRRGRLRRVVRKQFGRLDD